jgi:YD repeat-containing protein
MRKEVYVTHSFYDENNQITNQFINNKTIHKCIESTIFTYDDNGKLENSFDCLNNKMFKYIYDNNGRCVSIDVIECDEERVYTEFTINEYVYDDHGRKIKEICHIHDNEIEYTYDNKDNIISKKDRHGIIQYKYDYHNNITFEENSNGEVVRYKNKYNNKNKLIGYIEKVFFNDTEKPLVCKTKYKYDRNGNKTKIIQKWKHMINIVSCKYDDNNNCYYTKDTVFYF